MDAARRIERAHHLLRAPDGGNRYRMAVVNAGQDVERWVRVVGHPAPEHLPPREPSCRGGELCRLGERAATDVGVAGIPPPERVVTMDDQFGLGEGDQRGC